MPIYEYKGQQYDITTEDPAEAKAKILSFIEKQPPAPAPRVPDFAGNAAMSPQEQAYAATPKAGIASLRTPSAVPEMTEYTPSLPEMLMGLLPGDKAKAANEYAARKAAEERGVSVEEIYKGAGGARPMFNPEGRAPILAGTQAGKVIAKELPNIPQQTAVATLQAVRAGNIGAPGQETFLDKAINYMTPETPKGEQDKNYEAFQGLSKSLGFSLTTMVSSIVGAAAGTSVAGFPGGVAGGMGASGTVAYRSSKDDFLSRVRDKLNQESIKLYNKPISGSDWENAKKEFDSAASSYGAWEAVPEALSNAIMLKAFTGPARAAAGAGRLEQFMVKNNIAEKVASYATENITETTTGLGQRAAELRAGLTKEEMTIADAFRQQFVQTLLMSGGMQVGEKATHMASQFYQNKIEPRINPGSALGKAIMADLNAVEFSQSAINKEAIARLTPQKYQQEKLATEKVAKTARGIAMPPPPEEKLVEPPAAKPPVEPAGIAGLTAAPSESMDTEAMLREALGQTPAGVATLPPVKVETPKVDLIAEAPKYDTPDLRLKQSDAFGQDLMGVIYAEMESHGRAALKNRSLTDGYANKKDALVDAVDAGIIAFGKNDYSVFQPYEALFPKTAAKLKAHLTAQQPEAPTEIQPTVAKAGPFVRKQMEAQTPTTPTPVSIEGALSGIETPKAKQAEAQGEQAPAAPVIAPPTETPAITGGPSAPKGPVAPVEKPTEAAPTEFAAPTGFKYSLLESPAYEGITPLSFEDADFELEALEESANKGRMTPERFAQSEIGKRLDTAQIMHINAGLKTDPVGTIKALRNNIAPTEAPQTQQAETQEQQAPAAPAKKLTPEENYYDTFQKTALPETKAAFDNVEKTLGSVVAAINNLGYEVTDPKIKLNSEASKLKDQYNVLTADRSSLLSGHYALQKEFNSADQNKFNAFIKRANTSANNAQQVIRKSVPRPQEVTEAEQRVTEGEKAISKIKGKPGRSLWTALTGKLGASDIAELFGRSPQIYQKKLQAKKDTSGKSIADMVSDGDLDDFLPFQMRSNVPGFDGQEAEEYIKDQVRGQNYIPYDAQIEIEQIFGSVEEAEKLINDYLTIEEQNLELQEAADEERQGEINARSVEPESEIPSTEPDEGETLTKPTPEGLKAQEERRKAGEAAEAKAKKEAEEKAKADREVGEFTLTGSDRAADVAVAQGQKDIFAQEEEKVEEEPDVTEDGVKVVPFEADSETVGKLLSETPKEENPYDTRYNALMHPAEKPAKPKPTEMLTPEEAKAQIEEWKAEAARQGKTNKNFDRTIMSLFDASGEWSKPWREAGYNVWTFDIQTGEDINDFSAEYLLNEGFGDMNIWGILAAPPCTDFASSGAQFWAAKDAKGQTELSNELVKQVLRTVEFLQPKIWAMENPVGRIAKLNNLPPAHLTFDPNYYGDPYTKKTLLWGNFQNDLPMAPVEPTEGSKIIKLSGKDKFARSLTPEGFAYAFFMANNAESMTPAERLTRTYYGVDPKAFEGATEADEEAIDSSLFQDKYYDGELDEAADIARNIIGGKQEEEKARLYTPTAKAEDVIQVNGRDIPVTMNRLEKENQLVEVNSNTFDKAFSKTTWQYVGEGGEGGIEGRYKKFAEFIKDAKSMEAPNVSVDKNGAIVFGDGRHRYAYLRDSGVKNIPLSMDAESVKNAEKFGYISKQEEAKLEPVETPEGRNLRYPMAAVLFNDGYEVLALDNPRTYVDKGGEPHRTFEKDGVRVSLTPQLVLFQNKNAVLTGQGESTDMVINALLVDQAKRNQGKANEALQNIVDAADQYGVTLYIEPVPLVNLREKDFGLDSQQLEDLYKKFGFDFAEDSNKVMVREPEVEVLGPAEKPAAPRLTNEPYTIEGEFTEIGEEKQHALLTDQTSKLSEDQKKSLESQYGAKRDSTEFLDSLRKDVIAFITQGAKAVNGKIRAIIKQIANGVLSVAIVFNPQFVSKPYTIAVPQYDIKTSEVIKDLPKEAQSMSDAAKRAYGVIYPALEKQLKEKDKLFIVADKRSGNTYLFNPDGSLLLQSKTLFGKAIGDYMHGDNEIEANRITPAGVFDLGLRDAKRSAGEAYTAGDYDFGKVFVLDKSHMGSNGPYSNTIMHSVWTHETDAKQRLAALDKPGAEDSRYSFGCINVNKETFKYLITNHLNQMDGAKIFIVPENGANVMDFINGKAMNSDDIIRQKVEPVTKTTVTEKQVPAPKPGVERKQTGRETELAKLEVKTEEEAPGKEPKEPKERTFYDIGVDQTKTPEFKKWFGGSKIVDADGNPLVVSHISKAKPTVFDKKYKTELSSMGFHFGTKEQAQFRGTQYDFKSRSPTIGDYYLSIQNPLEVSHMESYAPDHLAEKMMYMDLITDEKYQSLRDKYSSEPDIGSALVKILQKAGYDGLVYSNEMEGEGNSYVPFEPTQIKSATENFGTYDPTNPDIRYNINGFADAEIEKRSTSLKRTIKTLNRMRKDGRITDEKFVEEADAAIAADEEQRLEEEPVDRVRGADFIRQKLLEAKRRKLISTEAAEMAEWFIIQNPALVDDLAISITGKGKTGQGGQYDSFNRLMTVIKNGASDLTTVHEILHHLERMMPTKIQQAIRKAWSSQLAKAAKAAKTPNEKLYFAALMDAHYGDGNIANIEVPKGAEKTYEQIKSLLEALQKRGSSEDFAMEMLKLGMVPVANYEYFNPSEFWAVNGSDIVKARFDAVRGGILARLKNWLKEFGQKVKSLFGLKSDASIIRALDSLAKSDGKFVTREMLGTGDYLSIERRNFRGNEAPEPTFEAPIPSALDTFAYNFLDKQHDMRSVIDEIQKVRGELVKEQVDPYLKNESFVSRKAAREENFVDNSIMPIVQEMYKNKVSILEVEEYMHNRHAEERNIQVAKINPSLPDGGSGITTANALKYLTEIPENKLKIYNKIAKMFDGIVDDTQQILVESGAETQKTINDWNNTYEYYAPLQREDLDFVNHGVGNGGGLGSRGSFSKRAFGSTKNVANILQNIVLQHKRAIDRAERIRVGKSLMGLVLTNPNPNFWIPVNPNAIKSIKKFKQEIQSLGISAENAENMLQEPKSPSIDKETGLVKYAVNPAMRSMDNVFPVRINGQDWFIIFNPSDERAMRMVRSLKNLDVEKLGIFFGTAGMVTRWISAINTQYNPIFGAFNFGRDVGTALLQLSTTELAGQQSKVMKSVMPALAAIFKEQRGWNKSKDVLDKDELTPQEWRDLYHRYRLAGGKTGISANFTQQKTRLEKLEKGWGIKGLLSVRATTDEISLLDKKLAEMDRGKIMAGAHWLFDYLSDYNEAMENAVRLATFKVAVLDNNMSDDKGASLAKNVTVNFDKKGAVVPKLQAWYSFINPGIRGAVLVKNVLTGPKGKIIIAGGIGLGIMQALLLFAAGFDDDDPPEFVKSKAFVIPTGGGKYFVMYPPYPPGFSMLPGIGRMLTEAFLIKSKMMKSNESASDKIFDILPMMFDSLNPLGIGTTYQQLVPTPLDPIANVILNKDAFGRPIAKTDRPGEETPGYERSRDSASSISKGIAYFLNWSSSPSGTLHTKGKISPTADQLDYFAEQYFGGVFREMVKAGESIGAKVKGEEQPMYRVPVAGKFFGETKTPAATSSRFYDNIEMLNAHEHEIKKRQEKREPTAEYLKENPEARLWKEANAAQKTIGNLNKEKKAATERGASKATIDAINERKVKAMKAFNDKVRAAQ